MLRKLVFILILFSLIVPSFAYAAGIDPSYSFSTKETEHFYIHYHQGIEALGGKAALIAEEAHCALTGFYDYAPSEKTHIVLVDNTDLTNGFATVLPYNLIYVFTTPPLPDMSIGQYEDWLRMVIYHEYTHILTMDPVRGYSKAMRNIFGRPLPYGDMVSFFVFLASVPPNVLMPVWWLESMTVWTESEFTPMGRGKGAHFDAIFRMAVYEDNIPWIDKFNGSDPRWPDGHMPYIYGLAMNRYIAKKYGQDALKTLVHSHSGRAPYFLNGAPENTYGQSYIDIYYEMVEDLKSEMNSRISVINSAPLTKFTPLTIEGESVTNPRFSPVMKTRKENSGKLYSLAVDRDDPHVHEAVLIKEFDGKDIIPDYEIGSVRRKPSDHGIAWSPDGQKIYFTQSELSDGYNLYQDLYSYDIRQDDLERMTDELRVKDPDASPDGKSIALVKVDPESQALAVLPVEEGAPLRVIGGYKFFRLSGPRWSPEGKFIAFSARDSAGKTSIRLYDTVASSIRTLIEDGSDNLYPTWSPDGKYIIFASDRSGVFNLFAYSMADGKLLKITNVMGAAIQPDISPDGKYIAFTYYHSKGFGAAVMDYAPENWTEATGPSIRPYWIGNPENLLKAEKCEESVSAESKAPPSTGETVEDEGYSAFGSLAPRFWLPTLGGDDDGTAFGAVTAGQDALGYHTYYLNVAHQFGGGNTYYDFIYLYDRLYPTLEFRAYKQPILYTEFWRGEDYWERATAYELSFSMPLKRLEKYASLRLGYSFYEQEHLDGPKTVFAGSEMFQGRRNYSFGELIFTNALRYPYSISREEGRKISLLYKDFSIDRGSDLDQQEYIGSWQEYFGIAGHHVVSLTLQGGASDGDRIPQQAFRIGGSGTGDEDFVVRGYETGFETGRHALAGSMEYRFPVKYIFRGVNTKPFFFEKLHLGLFTDAGVVFDDRDELEWSDVRTGVGMEVRLDMELGYLIWITPSVGYAHGLSRGGTDQIYISFYVEY